MDRLNIFLWKIIFEVFGAATDNVFVIILFTSTLFAISMYLLRKRFVKHPYIFLLPEWIFVLSVGFMVHRLPLIHDRLQTALSTVSGIILQSNTYKQAFQQISGLKELTSKNIASYIYFSEKSFQTDPLMLYEHCFRALDQIRKFPVLGEVHKSCFGTLSGMFIIMIVFAIIIWLSTMAQSGTRFRFIIVLLQSIILIILSFWNNGALFSAMVIWIMELVLHEIFISQK